MAYAKSQRGVYCILNLANQRHYIGSSENLNGRMREHFNALKRGAHKNRKLQNAWNKYGSDAFRFDVIEVIPSGDIVSAEQSWIDQTLPFYNLRRTAESNLGFKHSDETKAKISRAHVGKSLTDECKAKISTAMTGKTLSDEVRIKVGNARRGKKHSEETKAKIGASRVGVRYSEEARRKISEAAKVREAAKRQARNKLVKDGGK